MTKSKQHARRATKTRPAPSKNAHNRRAPEAKLEELKHRLREIAHGRDDAPLLVRELEAKRRFLGPHYNRVACRKATICGEAILVVAGFAGGASRCMKPCSASG